MSSTRCTCRWEPRLGLPARVTPNPECRAPHPEDAPPAGREIPAAGPQLVEALTAHSLAIRRSGAETFERFYEREHGDRLLDAMLAGAES